MEILLIIYLYSGLDNMRDLSNLVFHAYIYIIYVCICISLAFIYTYLCKRN